MSKLLLSPDERSRSDRMSLGSSIVAPFITTPLDLPNCVRWFDAADTATITHATNAVSRWASKGSNVTTLEQDTAARKPTTNTRTQNGLNTLDFDGTSDFMWYTEWLWSERVVGSTVFVAFVPDVATGVQSLLASSRTVSNNTKWRIGLELSTTYRPMKDYARDDGSVIASIRGPSAVAASTPYVIAVTEQVTSNTVSQWSIGKNGEARTSAVNFTTDVVATTPDVIMVGSWRWPTPVQWFNGMMLEIIRYSGIMSDSDIQMVVSYLMLKWGM